jgi:hypothetical protein
VTCSAPERPERAGWRSERRGACHASRPQTNLRNLSRRRQWPIWHVLHDQHGAARRNEPPRRGASGLRPSDRVAGTPRIDPGSVYRRIGRGAVRPLEGRIPACTPAGTLTPITGRLAGLDRRTGMGATSKGFRAGAVPQTDTHRSRNRERGRPLRRRPRFHPFPSWTAAPVRRARRRPTRSAAAGAKAC